MTQVASTLLLTVLVLTVAALGPQLVQSFTELASLAENELSAALMCMSSVGQGGGC